MKTLIIFLSLACLSCSNQDNPTEAIAYETSVANVPAAEINEPEQCFDRQGAYEC